MIESIKLEETTRRRLMFLKKFLNTFLISVASVLLFPTISFPQESLSKVNEVSNSGNNLKNDAQKII